MGRGKSRRAKEQIVKYEPNNITKEQLIEIQAEAYYRALKRIEQEKNETESQKQERKKDKWYINLLFILNILGFPFMQSKKFRFSNQVYDNVLILIVSGTLEVIGTILWGFGMISIIIQVINLRTLEIEGLLFIPVLLVFVMFGSIFIISGKEFNKENDSNKVYAYSACIIALISCVVSIVSLIK